MNLFSDRSSTPLVVLSRYLFIDSVRWKLRDFTDKMKKWSRNDRNDEAAGSVVLDDDDDDDSSSSAGCCVLCIVCLALQLCQRRVFDTSSTYVRGEENLQVT